MAMTLKEDLATLIGFPTVSNRPLTELAAWLAHRCEDLGMQVERFEDPQDRGKCSLICTAGPQTGAGLVMSGHMDVVPTEGQPWTTDPFRLTERDGHYVGRGTADMKGFAAVFLSRLASLNTATVSRPRALAVLITRAAISPRFATSRRWMGRGVMVVLEMMRGSGSPTRVCGAA